MKIFAIVTFSVGLALFLKFLFTHNSILREPSSSSEEGPVSLPKVLYVWCASVSLSSLFYEWLTVGSIRHTHTLEIPLLIVCATVCAISDIFARIRSDAAISSRRKPRVHSNLFYDLFVDPRGDLSLHRAAFVLVIGAFLAFSSFQASKGVPNAMFPGFWQILITVSTIYIAMEFYPYDIYFRRLTRLLRGSGVSARSRNENTAIGKRIAGAMFLKDFAVNSKLAVNDQILYSINRAQVAYHNSPSSVSAHLVALDEAIRDLTELTYPVTVESFEAELPEVKAEQRTLMYIAVVVSIAALWASCFAYVSRNTSTELRASVLAVALGGLGASVFILLCTTGDIEDNLDRNAAYLRVILGPVVGWVFFFAFAPNQFADALSKANQQKSPILLLPFVAGLSTKLVVSILDKCIAAVQTLIGIDNKTRTRSSKTGSTKVR